MKYPRKFSTTDTMVELVNYDYNVLPLLSRFSLPLGYGSMTIGEVCRDADIDSNVFMLIIQYTIAGTIDNEYFSKVKATDLVKFLENSHEYFISYKFPHIRQNLMQALDDYYTDINPSIVKFFDKFVSKVRNHFRYEERNLFPYVRALYANQQTTTYSIDTFVKQHDDIGDTLAEFKNIILMYYKTSVPNKMYDVLVDIYNCENDIQSHADIEDDILVPMVKQLIKD